MSHPGKSKQTAQVLHFKAFNTINPQASQECHCSSKEAQRDSCVSRGMAVCPQKWLCVRRNGCVSTGMAMCPQEWLCVQEGDGCVSGGMVVCPEGWPCVQEGRPCVQRDGCLSRRDGCVSALVSCVRRSFNKALRSMCYFPRGWGYRVTPFQS